MQYDLYFCFANTYVARNRAYFLCVKVASHKDSSLFLGERAQELVELAAQASALVFLGRCATVGNTLGQFLNHTRNTAAFLTVVATPTVDR